MMPIHWYNDIADEGGWVTLEHALDMVMCTDEVSDYTVFDSVFGMYHIANNEGY